jgi:UPF0755 protein
MSKYPFLTDEMFNSNVRIYLEGYLAPDTYIVDKETTAEVITEKILDQTLAIYQKNAAAIMNSKLSVHEIYTLASIVQYEGGGDEETTTINNSIKNESVDSTEAKYIAHLNNKRQRRQNRFMF